MQEQDPLAQLRDIHLPEASSAWPPAPGWWLAGCLLLLLLFVIAQRMLRAMRRNQYRKLALQQLLGVQLLAGQPALYLAALNQLLKQTAVAAKPTIDIASLSGVHWLQFLDHSGSTTQFSQGVGQVLNHGPYAPTAPEFNSNELTQLIKQWIKQHDVRRSGSQQ